MGKVVFEPGSHLNTEERTLVDWITENFDDQITVLAESFKDGIFQTHLQNTKEDKK